MYDFSTPIKEINHYPSEVLKQPIFGVACSWESGVTVMNESSPLTVLAIH
jgi:hypothetical protein